MKYIILSIVIIVLLLSCKQDILPQKKLDIQYLNSRSGLSDLKDIPYYLDSVNYIIEDDRMLCYGNLGVNKLSFKLNDSGYMESLKINFFKEDKKDILTLKARLIKMGNIKTVYEWDGDSVLYINFDL